ncbi:GNAT family N-acetyltransferase [Streptomyces sp. XD-27]|uniref:GNAT family N-acetyltransferase n=1 Tax=Streptomyces sp. XD-27 TaxID=3062779 RepID=UPI0026F470E4|nr:GNAT family N-acetyltransferase [Streptomyces sp. XD-27]WKX70104.1 GNAT family N-acetyltransferase [Streptomyces sp. XD-27]
MTESAAAARPLWTVAAQPVHSAEASALLREYFIEIADRWYERHYGRRSTPEEIASGLIEHHSDDLVPPYGALLVGRYGGEPGGCVGLRLREARTAELTRLFIRPACRGQGGGAALLAAAERTAREMGARRVILDTRLDLVEARALYARHGFAEIAPYKEDPYAECFYGKDLEPSPSIR